MKTVTQWLEEVVTNPTKLNHWLQRQYVGEMLAAQRIQQIADAYQQMESANPSAVMVLARIANDERNHAQWVKELLELFNIELPEVTLEGTRYWQGDELDLPFTDLMALGHHAETMRLQRIVALSVDTRVHVAIQAVFSRVLQDEIFHARAFGDMTEPNAIERMRTRHQEGLERLGLEI